MTRYDPGKGTGLLRSSLSLARLRESPQARILMATAMVNIGSTVITAGSGIVIARALGPADRGDFAAVSVWFGLILIVGELGQTAATTYHVARYPDRAKAVTATSRVMLTITGLMTAGAGFALAPLLAHHEADLTLAYRLVFVSCLPVFLSASFHFALQATSIAAWNALRLSQPVAYLSLVVVAQMSGWLTVIGASAILGGTVSAQSAVAYVLARRRGLAGGRAEKDLLRPLATYGASQVLATAPQNLNTRLDQIVLSQTVRSSDLGHYAVAVTLSSLAVPMVSALGNVLFPRMAAMRRTEAEERLVRSAVVASLVLGAVGVGVIAATASVTVPLLFGDEYRDSVRLVWLLAPAGVFLAAIQVMSDLLRGRGQPLHVARGQVIGLLVTIGGLALLIPLWGVSGAAVVSSLGAGVTWFVLLLGLRTNRERIEMPIPDRST